VLSLYLLPLPQKETEAMKKSFLSIALLAAVAFASAAAAGVVPVDLHAHVLGLLSNHGDVILAFGPAMLALQGKQAAVAESMRALMTHAEGEDRDLTAEEQKSFDAKALELAGLKARIERQQALALTEAGLAAAAPVAAPVDRGVAIAAASTISVRENLSDDPKRGFKSFGEFARSVHMAAMSPRSGAPIDNRLQFLQRESAGLGFQAAAPGTYGNEGSGADGGFLVAPGFSSEIFVLSLTDGAFLPYCDDMPIDGNSMSIPKDETTPWGTNGIRAYWQAEAGAGTPTKPVLSMMDLRLKKLLALCPVSDELLADTSALTSYLPKKVAMSLQWKINEALMFGLGNGTPLGAFSGAAAVVQAKDAAQATNTLSALNLANMISRLPPGSFGNAVWIINNAVLPSLFTLTIGSYPIYLPAQSATASGSFQQNPYGMLLGRPIIVSQHAKAFSAQGDVVLADFSYYQAITKAEGMQTATSMHLYFDADAMAFRTTFRMDGQPKLAAPINPANGAVTLSPFIQLAAR
jgi:HK97 family phage major capsid protein